MKILITGNLGYVGTILTKNIKGHKIYGLDAGYFKDILQNKYKFKKKIFKQYIADIRNIDYKILDNIDCVVHLAGVSNDPIGSSFKDATKSINIVSTKKLIVEAKKRKIKSFIFASSCSVYGLSKKTCYETSKTQPLTIYAKSKIIIENFLRNKSSHEFRCTSLRFATACGYSFCPRFDIVVNNLVLSAFKKNKLILNSNGGAKRPLIDVSDMAKSIIWSIEERSKLKSQNLILNVGSNKNNFTIKKLAKIISAQLGNVKVETNDKIIDNRSYKVSFSKYKKYAKRYKINKNIKETIRETFKMTKDIKSKNFERFIRLSHLNDLKKKKKINKLLKFSK